MLADLGVYLLLQLAQEIGELTEVGAVSHRGGPVGTGTAGQSALPRTSGRENKPWPLNRMFAAKRRIDYAAFLLVPGREPAPPQIPTS
jgi:hypothetical protein